MWIPKTKIGLACTANCKNETRLNDLRRREPRNAVTRFKSALRKPQSAQKAALPQNCLTATRIVPLLWTFVNTSGVIVQLLKEKTRRKYTQEIAVHSQN